MAGKRAAFSSARIMRSFRNSAESTRSADANGAQMECNGKDKDKERNRCGQKVQTDIGKIKPTAGQPKYRCAKRNRDGYLIKNKAVSDVGVDGYQQRNCQAAKGCVSESFTGHLRSINHERLPKSNHAHSKNTDEPPRNSG